MKKMISHFISFCIFFFLSNICFSQGVVVNNGGSDLLYLNLGNAFTAINQGIITGNITINIVDDLTEPSSCSLNASGSPTNANYTSILIRPQGGSARTITGAINGSLINLNGADNVTIDGLNTGGNSLTFINTATGASSTLRFINGAAHNTITNSTFKGSTSAVTPGVIFFSTTTTTGNDSNTVSNCNITAAGTNYPTNGIYSEASTLPNGNSRMIINNNNISDFFSDSFSPNGIYSTNSNSPYWTISNNRLFSTFTQVYTAANRFNGMFLSGIGHTVTGNTVGYSSAAGTGIMTLTSTANLRFEGITMGGSGIDTFSVQGNTITAINFTTGGSLATSNGVFCGMAIGAGRANIGNITPNIIGGSSGTGLITVTSTASNALLVGIVSNSNTTNLKNNIIGGLSSQGSSLSAGGNIIGISINNLLSTMNVTGNIVGNATPNNMVAGSLSTTGSSNVVGISCPPTTGSGTNTISDNTIQNLTSYGSGSGGYVRGISTGAVTFLTMELVISNNTVKNLTTNSSLTTSTNGQVSAVGINIAEGDSSNVKGNTISNISNTNTGTGGYIVAGISHANTLNTKIDKNIIYNLSNASNSTTTTAPGIVAGILITTAVTSDTVANNMIAIGQGQTTNTSFIGIMCQYSTTPNAVNCIFYNSVYISGTVTSGAQPSMCFMRGDFSSTARTIPVNIKNNVFDNARTGGTGKHYAIANNYGATASSTGWIAGASNNNVFNSISSSTIGFWTTDQTFAGWKATSSNDALSLSAIPITYTDAFTANLRFNMGLTPTMLESGGVVLTNITTDIDGFVRPKPFPVNHGGTAPDFGASESDMVPLDLTGPNIYYTPLINTVPSTSRTLTNFATINDSSGVNTISGTNPRIYYKRTTDVNAFGGNTSGDNGWKWVQATNGTSPFSFTMDFTIIFGGSINSGDVIQYFVTAQDLNVPANVSANPSSGFSATSVGSISSSPTTPNSFNVAAGIPSVVYLGSGLGTPNYPSFSGAAGLFNAINTGAVNSNVLVVVQNNLIEDGTVSLNQFESGNRIIVVPGAASVFTIEGTTAAASDALLEMNGADDFLIDGRYNGAGRYLRFINNNSTPANTGPILKFQNDSRRCGIGFCTMESNSSSSTNPMILFSGTTGSEGNDSLLVDSCLFKNSTGTNPGSYFTAIGSTGNSTGNAKNSSIAVIQNNFTGWLPASTAVIDFSAGSMGDSIVCDTNRIYNNITMTSSWTAIKLTNQGNNCTANFNSIGGSNPDRSGSPIFANTGITMIGIDIKAGNTITSNIHGNNIANICNMTVGNTSSGIVKGINIGGGRLNVGTLIGNTIGGKNNPWDTVTTSDDNGWIDITTASASDTLLIWNNTVSYANYWRKRSDRNCGINISGSSGAYIDVYNNSINNMRGNNTGNGSSAQLFAIRLGNNGANNTINVRNNIIHTIIHSCDTAIINTTHEIAGIMLSTANVTNQKLNIYNNKLYNLQSNSTATTDTGSTAPTVSAIRISSGTGIINVYNNAISLGTQSGTPTRLYGIYNSNSSSSLNCNIYYNSVYIGGTATGLSPNTVSYGFLRNTAGLTVLKNNIFYNSRSGGARNIAIGNLNATNWVDTTSNYNLFVANSSNQCGTFTSSNPSLNFTAWKSTSLGDGASLFETSSNLDASNLWVNPASSDLTLNNGQQAVWYAAGQGTPITYPSISSDINGNSRSVTILDGATDIGCSEIGTPPSQPPTVIGPSVTTSGTYDLEFGGKKIASITFNPGTTGYPFTISSIHFGGSNPPGATTQEYANFYDSIYVSSGTPGVLNYDIKMYIYSNTQGNIGTIANTRIAKSGDGGTTWTPQLVNGSYIAGTPPYALATGVNSFSLFTLTSIDNPLPVELVSFTSTVIRNEVKLNWITKGENNNSGFDIERKSTDASAWIKAGNLQGHGTTNEERNYVFLDKGLTKGKYNYRLKQIDYNGDYKYFNLQNDVEIGIPSKFELCQNYPNPFNPTTKINFSLPSDTKVKLNIYDISGREIAVLINNDLRTAGYYSIDFDGTRLASGFYIYRIQTDKDVSTKKMILLK